VKPEGVVAVEVLAGGSPVPGAQVQLYWRESREASAPPPRWDLENGGETNGSGHWETPAQPGSYFIAVRAEGFAPGTLGVLHPPGGARTAVRLRLEAKVGLSGHTVVWGTGEPVSFAEIILSPLAFPSHVPGHLDVPEEELLSTTSNEAGEFSFAGLAPGRYRAETRAPGFARKVLPSVPVPFGARLTLALAPGGRIEGIVVGTDGQPVAGAEVLAFNSAHEATGLTHEQGGFSLELPTGTYSVSARHKLEAGTLGREITVNVEQTVRGLRLQLGAGARISGQVLWEDGKAAIGARVEARIRGVRGSSGEVATDERGAFSLPSLAAGTYDVKASMPLGGRLEHPGLPLAAGEHATLTLTYKRRGALTVRVKDMSARPVAGARIKVQALQVPAAALGQVHEGQTDAQGRLQLAELMPGQYHVEAQHTPDALSQVQTVIVTENKQRDVLFWVPGTQEGSEAAPGRASLVEGRVVQRSGAEPEGPVRIDVFRPGDLRPGIEPIPLRTAFADAQGRFWLELSPGSYTLTAQRLHRLRCERHARAQIQLEAAQRTQATLVLEEPQEPGVKVRVQEMDGQPSRLTPVALYRQGLMGTGQTDASGQLELCFSRPFSFRGPLLIRALEPKRDGLLQQAGSQPELTVRLQPLPTLRGRVTPTSGTPVTGFHLELLHDTVMPLISYDFLGDQFELRELPLGRGQLLVSLDDGRRALVLIDTSSGEDIHLEVPVHPGVTLTGRIVNATTGAPFTEAEVLIQSLAHARAGRDGRFTLPNLPVGEYQLQIMTGFQHLSQRLSVTLKPGPGHDLGDIAVTPR
jgi:hypothetical protein